MRLPGQAMKPSVFFSTVIGGLVAFPAIASAQDQAWLKDRRYTEGPGYQVGDFELHPGVALELGYDSNYLRQNPSMAGGVDGALRAMLTPSLSFSTLSPQRTESAPSPTPPSVTFKGGVSVTENAFYGVNGPSPIVLRGLEAPAVNLDFALGILPGRPWSGYVTGNFARALTPSQDGLATSTGALTTTSYNRDVPQVGAEIAWTPGSGLFEWRVGYQFTGTLFEELGQLTNLQNEIETRGRWRFLPRTSLVYDARFDFINYTNPAPDGKAGSHPIRARIGINGLVTSSFSVLAMIGWGASFYNSSAPPAPSQNFDSAIGQVELKWYLAPRTSADPNASSPTLSAISVGFLRDFYDSYLGQTFFERDRGYASLSYFFGGRFLLVASGGVAPIIYPVMVFPTNQTVGPFTDIHIDASLFGEYRIRDSFGINATVRYNQEIGSTGIPTSMPGTTETLAYQEFEAYLGVRWLM
jgi:hypothetical protein